VLFTVSVADRAVPTSAIVPNTINLEFAGDGTGDATRASGEDETAALTVSVTWAGAHTSGQTSRNRVAGDGDTSD
jgi:hypothetical protein